MFLLVSQTNFFSSMRWNRQPFHFFLFSRVYLRESSSGCGRVLPLPTRTQLRVWAGAPPPPGDKLSRRGIYGLLVEYKSNSCIPKIDYKFYCKKVFWFSSSWVELNLNHNDWNSLNYVHLKNEKQLYLPHCQSDSGLQLKGNCCLL